MKTINKVATGLTIIFLLTINMSFLMKPNYSNSSIHFKIKNAGIGVDGSFKKFETTIDFSESANAPISIKATIETASIDTGIEARDKHLRKEEFFNVETFSKITFESNHILKLSTGGLIAEGKLIIKGITKDVKIPFTYKGNAEGGVFEGALTINRLDYGVGGSSITMGDTVDIVIKVTASK